MTTENARATRNSPARPHRRNMALLLCCGPLILACAASAGAREPDGAGARADSTTPMGEMEEMEMLRDIAAAPLTPDQAVDKRHIGKRVRWAGGVHHIKRTDKGICLTILYARSGDYGGPHWTAKPTYQDFDACTAGTYDPELVHEYTNVTIVGRIAGTTYIGMGGGGSIGPVVEIEKLFRWSDCLAGDTSPVCKHGFLTPDMAADD